MSPVEPKRKPENLDDLLTCAERYAEAALRKTGSMLPVLFLVGPDGPQMLVPDNLADAAAKDDFATTARLMCIAHGATACVMGLEAWAKFATGQEQLDPAEPPSESFDRKEIVVLMGEDRAGKKQKLLPIVRSDNGTFFGFGEGTLPAFDGMEGRFAQILPPNIPAEKERCLAKAILQVKGVAAGKPATKPERRHRR